MRVTVRFCSSAAGEGAARGSRSLIALVILLGFLVVASLAHAAGELDATFDGDGRVVTDFFFGYGENDEAHAVAIQADGKIVVAGESDAGRPNPEDFALARYKPDGSLDPSFDGDGRVLTDIFTTDRASAVAIQADGKIVAAGRTVDASFSGFNFALTRYNPDGSLDPTFDGDGMVATDLGGDLDEAFGVAIQADHKIVAVGFSDAGVNRDFALARYNADGSLDPTFDGDGRVLTDIGPFDHAYGVSIQADGRIVAAGSSGAGPNPGNFALARYNPDGSLDPSFDGDGRVATDFGLGDVGLDIAIQADGKIVAAGRTGGSGTGNLNFALARYRPDGSLDPSFDGDGRVTTDLGGVDEGRGVAIQVNGKIVAAGLKGGDFALARYNSDGSLDASFDGDGKVVTNFGAGDGADDIAIQPDGKIVAVGWTSTGANPYNFALARYLPAGTTLPSISINDVTRFEGNAGLTSFTFRVSLSIPSSQTVTVSRRTSDGTASAPSDYTALGPATITFSPGQEAKAVTVKVRGDVAIEPKEDFFVNLSNPTNATIADGTGKGAIVNDDLSGSVPCTITGTPGNDVLDGTAGNDVICGGNGDDHLFGHDGADVLKGETGDDVLFGLNGVDLLIGATGADDLMGESGNDTLRGGDNGDVLNGGANSDALFGENGTDSLNTQDGVSANDHADGGSDSDNCVFDSGDFVTSCP